MEKRFIKVFGERNTGTRALISMLLHSEQLCLRSPFTDKPLINDKMRRLTEAMPEDVDPDWKRFYHDELKDSLACEAQGIDQWKHSAPRWDMSFQSSQAAVIFMIRNPYSWLISLYKRPYHMKGPRPDNLLEFIKSPWVTERRDNVSGVLRSPIDLWNDKICSYNRFVQIAFCYSDVPMQMPFEFFVMFPQQSVARIFEHFEMKKEMLTPSNISTKTSKLSLSELRNYYREEKWKQYFNREMITFINSRLNEEHMENCDYMLLDPMNFPVEAFKEVQPWHQGSYKKPLH